MSVEREAWSGRPAAEPGRDQRPATRRPAAFTLIEVMVAVAIIAIMSALLTPAVRGLLGVSGPRGGMNTLTAALEQARLAAMESGVPAYAGLAVDTNGGHSAVIVFRDPRDDETNRLVPVTRWIKMPQGVYHKSGDLESFPVPAGTLPRLGTNNISPVSVVRFDRFGRLSQTTTPRVVQLGAMTAEGGEFLGGANNYFELTIHPLTGRASVLDKAMEGMP
jgi:prepilin-type N-terminal cleavage/methylation domain-containing protein